MYQPKKHDAFYYSLLIMRYLHYYPSPRNENKNLKFYYAISILLRTLSSFVIWECAIHCIMALIDGIPVDLTEDAVGLVAGGNSMLYCIFFELNVRGWRHLFLDITDTKKFGTPPNLQRVIKRANRYAFIYFIYCYGGMFIYLLVSILDTGRCQKLNADKGLQEICGLLMPVWWPHEDINPFSKFIVLALQVNSGIFYVPPSAILSFIPWEASEVIVTKIKHLKGLLQDAFDTDDADLMRSRLRFCVQYHQEIIRISKDLNKKGKRIYGQLSFVGAFILSCLGAQMLKEYSVRYLIYFWGYFVSLFLVCHAGQKLTDETYNIQDAVYASKWYQADPKLARDLKLIFIRSQKPVHMEAIPLGMFDYNFLIIALKTAYSYLTLITSTTK